LPPTPQGSALDRATLVLHLSSNADVSLAARRLSLHRLNVPFDEARASWSRYDNGHKWDQPGGDYGAELATVDIESGTANGDVRFDLTEPLGSIMATSPVALAWIVLEPSTAPSVGELAFASSDRDVPEAPSLVLEYCNH
jgi:hypothetical protein